MRAEKRTNILTILQLIMIIGFVQSQKKVERLILSPLEIEPQKPVSIKKVFEDTTNGSDLSVFGWIKLTELEQQKYLLIRIANMDNLVSKEQIITIYFDNSLTDNPLLSIDYLNSKDNIKTEDVQTRLQPGKWIYIAYSVSYSSDEMLVYLSDFDTIQVFKKINLNYRNFEIRNRLRIDIGCEQGLGLALCLKGSIRDFSYSLNFFEQPEYLFLLNPQNGPEDNRPMVFTFDLYNNEIRGGLSSSGRRGVFEILDDKEVVDRFVVNEFDENEQEEVEKEVKEELKEEERKDVSDELFVVNSNGELILATEAELEDNKDKEDQVKDDTTTVKTEESVETDLDENNDAIEESVKDDQTTVPLIKNNDNETEPTPATVNDTVPEETGEGDLNNEEDSNENVTDTEPVTVEPVSDDNTFEITNLEGDSDNITNTDTLVENNGLDTDTNPATDTDLIINENEEDTTIPPQEPEQSDETNNNTPVVVNTDPFEENYSYESYSFEEEPITDNNNIEDQEPIKSDEEVINNETVLVTPESDQTNTEPIEESFNNFQDDKLEQDVDLVHFNNEFEPVITESTDKEEIQQESSLNQEELAKAEELLEEIDDEAGLIENELIKDEERAELDKTILSVDSTNTQAEEDLIEANDRIIEEQKELEQLLAEEAELIKQLEQQDENNIETNIDTIEPVNDKEDTPLTVESTDNENDTLLTEESVNDKEDTPLTIKPIDNEEEVPLTDEPIDNEEEMPLTVEPVDNEEETPLAIEPTDNEEEVPFSIEPTDNEEETPLAIEPTDNEEDTAISFEPVFENTDNLSEISDPINEDNNLNPTVLNKDNNPDIDINTFEPIITTNGDEDNTNESLINQTNIINEEKPNNTVFELQPITATEEKPNNTNFDFKPVTEEEESGTIINDFNNEQTIPLSNNTKEEQNDLFTSQKETQPINTSIPSTEENINQFTEEIPLNNEPDNSLLITKNDNEIEDQFLPSLTPTETAENEEFIPDTIPLENQTEKEPIINEIESESSINEGIPETTNEIEQIPLNTLTNENNQEDLVKPDEETKKDTETFFSVPEPSPLPIIDQTNLNTEIEKDPLTEPDKPIEQPLFVPPPSLPLENSPIINNTIDDKPEEPVPVILPNKPTPPPESIINQVQELNNLAEGQQLINSQSETSLPDARVKSSSSTAGSFAFNPNSSINSELFNDINNINKVEINNRNELPPDLATQGLIKPREFNTDNIFRSREFQRRPFQERLLSDTNDFDNILFTHKKHLFIENAFTLNNSKFINSPTIYLQFLYSEAIPDEFKFIQLKNTKNEPLVVISLVKKEEGGRLIKAEASVLNISLYSANTIQPDTETNIAISFIQHNNHFGIMIYDGKESKFSSFEPSTLKTDISVLFLDSSTEYTGSFRFFILDFLEDPSGLLLSSLQQNKQDNGVCLLPLESTQSSKCLKCDKDKSVLSARKLECLDYCPLGFRNISNICYQCIQSGCTELDQQFFKMSFLGDNTFAIAKTKEIPNFDNNYVDMFDIEVEDIPGSLYSFNITNIEKDNSAKIKFSFTNTTDPEGKLVKSKLKESVHLYDISRTRLQNQVVRAKFGTFGDINTDNNDKTIFFDDRVRNEKVEDVFELLGFIIFIVWTITMFIGFLAAVWDCGERSHKPFLYQKVMQSFMMYQYMMFWAFYNTNLPFNLISFFNKLLEYSVTWHDVFTGLAKDQLGDNPDFIDHLILKIHRRFYERDISTAFLLSFAFILVFQGGVYVIFILLRVCYRKKNIAFDNLIPQKRSFFTKLIEAFQFKLLVSVFMIFVVEMTVFACYNVYGWNTDHILFVLSFMLSCLYLLIALCLIIFITVYVSKSSRILNRESNLANWGFIHEGLKLKMIQKFFQGFQYMHYALFGVVLVVAYDERTVQIALNLSFLTVFFIYIFTTLPPLKPFDRYEQLLVHLLLLLGKVFIAILVLDDTFDILSQFNRWVMGYLVACTICVIVIWNFIVILIKTINHMRTCSKDKELQLHRERRAIDLNLREDEEYLNNDERIVEEERSRTLNYEEEVARPNRRSLRKLTDDNIASPLTDKRNIEGFNLSDKIRSKTSNNNITFANKQSNIIEKDEAISEDPPIPTYDDQWKTGMVYRQTADFNKAAEEYLENKQENAPLDEEDLEGVKDETESQKYYRHQKIVEKRLENLDRLKEERYREVVMNNGGLKPDSFGSPPVMNQSVSKSQKERNRSRSRKRDKPRSKSASKRQNKRQREERIDEDTEGFIKNNFAFDSDIIDNRKN